MLQQDLEDGLGVCSSSSWIQHKMPFCNTAHKCFSAFQLVKTHRTANYHWVIQSAIVQALTCHLKRKESALYFTICREIFVPRKVGSSFQIKTLSKLKNDRNIIRRRKTYFTPSPLCSPITTCTTILYLSNPSSGGKEESNSEHNNLFKI